MIRLLAATAATLLTFNVIASLGARAGCDEECAYEAHEAAYERAYERASAREEAAEEGYSEDRSSSRSSRRRAKADYKAAPAEQIAEPKPASPTQSQPTRAPRTRVATENSSIATGESEVAEDYSFGRAPIRKEVGCKKFFASAGMTLTVPCE